MPTLLALALAAGTLWIASFVLRRNYRRGTLTAGRFALVFAAGWSLALLIVFFGGLADVIAERRDESLGLLGAGIVTLNFALAFGIASLLYRPIISAVSRRRRPPE
jgi:hypothetical protein